MRYVRTQIYLDPDDHQWLSDEAHARGMSLTALIRQIVSGFTRGSAPLRPEGLASLIGIVDGEPSDIARDEARYKRSAIEVRLGKKLERKGTAPVGRRKR
jgi:hypothetical protein